MQTNLIFPLRIHGTDDPRRYVASVPDGAGSTAASHEFEWRIDSTELHLTLGSLARAVQSGSPPDEPLQAEFGGRLYQAVFGGDVGALWVERRKAARRKPLRLTLSIDPGSAGALVNLPWEYLHDGERFLALDRHTPFSRLPWGLEEEAFEPVSEALRLVNGVRRVMVHYGMLPEESLTPTHAIVLKDFIWHFSDQKGLWYPGIEVGDSVEEGQLLGRITDIWGNELQPVYALASGRVLFLVSSLSINKGDPLLSIGA